MDVTNSVGTEMFDATGPEYYDFYMFLLLAPLHLWYAVDFCFEKANARGVILCFVLYIYLFVLFIYFSFCLFLMVPLDEGLTRLKVMGMKVFNHIVLKVVV